MNSKKYLGIVLFIILTIALIFLAYFYGIKPKFEELASLQDSVNRTQTELNKLRSDRATIASKIKKLRKSKITSQKKVYSPTENYSDDKNDTLFFTLYSDLMEMLHANSIKIKSIDYKYNPSGDKFTEQGSLYFVCDINMDIVSNYINLGKLIQDIYQYPYYIRINQVEVKPYPKDKKILLSKLSLRLYAHTEPEEADTYVDEETDDTGENSVNME